MSVLDRLACLVLRNPIMYEIQASPSSSTQTAGPTADVFCYSFAVDVAGIDYESPAVLTVTNKLGSGPGSTEHAVGIVDPMASQH